MAKIITLTMNPTVDSTSEVDHVVADRKLRCGRPDREPGGGGVNVARALQKLGSRALAVYPVGGALGRLLERLLDAEEIDHHGVRIDGETRENFTVIETESDRQFRFVMPGPELGEAEWTSCIEAVSQHDAPEYVIASGSLPPGTPSDFYAKLSGELEGPRLVLDTSGEALRHGIDGGAYLIKPNLRELSQIAGRELTEEAEQERVARELVEAGKVEVVVVSMGAAGVLLVTADVCERIRTPSVPIRSRVGAGDSTVAGIVFGLCRGDDIRSAVRLGVAAGAAAVMTPGTELCRRDDTMRLYRSITENLPGTSPQ